VSGEAIFEESELPAKWSIYRNQRAGQWRQEGRRARRQRVAGAPQGPGRQCGDLGQPTEQHKKALAGRDEAAKEENKIGALDARERLGNEK